MLFFLIYSNKLNSFLLNYFEINYNCDLNYY